MSRGTAISVLNEIEFGGARHDRGAGVVSVLIALVTLALVLGGCSLTLGLRELGAMPEFRFIDHERQAFASEDHLGKVWLVDFIYTRCTNACPLLTHKLAQIQGELASLGVGAEDVIIVSITVDPFFDKPEVLRSFAARYQVDTSWWRFLSAEPEDIKRVATEFGLAVSTEYGSTGHGSGSQPILHSNRIILVDRMGQVRAMYPTGEPDDTPVDQIVSDVQTLLD